jgi:hypothetical protein
MEGYTESEKECKCVCFVFPYMPNTGYQSFDFRMSLSSEGTKNGGGGPSEGTTITVAKRAAEREPRPNFVSKRARRAHSSWDSGTVR